MYDKEHFNTFELLNSEDREFYIHGHNRIYQYFLILLIIKYLLKFFSFMHSKKYL